MRSKSGATLGYGFVRFGSESDYRDALGCSYEPGALGDGVKVTAAVPSPELGRSASSARSSVCVYLQGFCVLPYEWVEWQSSLNLLRVLGWKVDWRRWWRLVEWDRRRWRGWAGNRTPWNVRCGDDFLSVPAGLCREFGWFVHGCSWFKRCWSQRWLWSVHTRRSVPIFKISNQRYEEWNPSPSSRFTLKRPQVVYAS